VREIPKSWTTVGTAEMIRGLLISRREAYPREIYHYLKAEITEMGYKPPSYNSVRKMIYVLEKMGLIRFVREEPVAEFPTAFKRRYYEVTPGREEDPAWRNPYAALYYPARFRRMTMFREASGTPEEWMENVRASKLKRRL